MEYKTYCGVGARNTPDKVLDVMSRIAIKMSNLDYTLRSGGAIGADKAFEEGALKKEIYYASDANEKAMELAKFFHPAWNSLGGYAKKLHARNAFQVLGRDLIRPSRFLICWTPDNAINHQERNIKTGGTGTAISIASGYGVQVFNLKREDHMEKILKWLE